MNEEKTAAIQWHPAFVAAMDLEFAKNRDDLISEKEYNLNTQPLRIDLLVIKKKKNAVIENEIGRFFRGYNVMEYKSPEDSLNIDDVYKTMAYASLYKAYGKSVDEIKADDITVSIVREGKPEKLFEYFSEHDDKVLNYCDGIYYINGSYPFPMQIIVTRELESTGHIWLKALSDKLKEEELKSLIRNIHQLVEKQDRESADSVFEVSLNANKRVADKVKGDDEAMCQALMELMKPEIMEKEKEAKSEGIREGMREGIREGIREGMREGIQGTVDILHDMGHSDDEIKERIMKKFSLSLEEANGYL